MHTAVTGADWSRRTNVALVRFMMYGHVRVSGMRSDQRERPSAGRSSTSSMNVGEATGPPFK